MSVPNSASRDPPLTNGALPVAPPPAFDCRTANSVSDALIWTPGSNPTLRRPHNDWQLQSPHLVAQDSQEQSRGRDQLWRALGSQRTRVLRVLQDSRASREPPSRTHIGTTTRRTIRGSGWATAFIDRSHSRQNMVRIRVRVRGCEVAKSSSHLPSHYRGNACRRQPGDAEREWCSARTTRGAIDAYPVG